MWISVRSETHAQRILCLYHSDGSKSEAEVYLNTTDTAPQSNNGADSPDLVNRSDGRNP
jgi:hypothetical protein